ncbi:hypothetical protein D0Z03_002583 [Geotrichum reessii]|nr:hypothetical protein D0Z03_002583 [Galactomyces reessii]
MQLTSVLALTSTLATIASAQAFGSIPSQQEIEAQIAQLYVSDPVYSSLTAYYATHSFSTGSKLASWLSKIETMAVLTEMSDSGPNAQQISQLQQLYSELPLSEYTDLLYQYFPTAIVPQPTDILSELGQIAGSMFTTQDSPTGAVSSSGLAKETGFSSETVVATAASDSSVTHTSKPSSVVTSHMSSGGSAMSEKSIIESGGSKSSGSESSGSKLSASESSASKIPASESSAAASSASTSHQTSATPANGAAHMSFSSVVAVGLSATVAALILI